MGHKNSIQKCGILLHTMAKISVFAGLTKNILLFTLISFFADISTEMLYPVLPIFLTQTLRASVGTVGMIEGIATATQNIVQAFSGYFADKVRNRKLFAICGYGLAALSKPFMGVASVWQMVLAGRFSDRFGTGMRSAPRDALIASSVAKEHRGKAFGLEGIGDNAGAFIGPLVAIVFLFFLKQNIRSIFYLAFIPGFLAFLMILLVREKKIELQTKTPLSFSVKNFSFSYWKYITVTILFGLGNISSSFLILATKNKGVPFSITIGIYACFNLVAALVSYPAGSYSDKIGRKHTLIFGFFIALLTFWGFALNNNIIIIGILFILYGVFQGIFRTVGKAIAVDFVSPEYSASAIGLYATAVGLSGLLASVSGGWLWTILGPQATFLYAGGFAALGTLALLLIIPKRTPTSLEILITGIREKPAKQ